MEESLRWYALKTKHRFEKKAFKDLNIRKIDCFLPLFLSIKKYKSKTKKVYKPLINCYIFALLNKKNFTLALDSLYISSIVSNGKEATPIKENEINWLKYLVNEAADFEIEEQCIMKGDNVEITAGPMIGLKGTVMKENKNVLFVNLESVGLSIKLTIDKKMLKKIK